MQLRSSAIFSICDATPSLLLEQRKIFQGNILLFPRIISRETPIELKKNQQRIDLDNQIPVKTIGRTRN